MRILIISTEYVNFSVSKQRGGGIARVVFEAAEEMKKQGVQVDICSPEGPQIVIPTTGLPARVGLLFFWQKAMKKLRSVEGDYDAIWLHNPILLRRYVMKKPMVATVHSTTLGKNKQFRSLFFTAYVAIFSVLELWSNRAVNKSDFEVTCVSNSVYNELVNIKPDKKRIVRNGSMFPIVMKSVPRTPAPGSIKFLSVGRVDKIKNPDRIIRLYRSISKEIAGCSLTIIGDGPEFSRLVSENKDSTIVFKGFLNHDDLLPYYDESEFFLMASQYEGCPLTLLDAVNRGLKCIVPNIPSLTFVEEMELGMCFDHDSDEIASKQLIEYVKQNAGKPRENRVDFTWKPAVDTLLSLFSGKKVEP